MANVFLTRLAVRASAVKSRLAKAARGRMAIAAGMTLLVVLLMMWLLGAFHRKIGPAEVQPQGRPIGNAELIEVRQVSLPVIESASGTILPVHESQVASQVMGKILKINVRAGMEVKQDDELVVLDDSVLKEKLAQAKANLEGAVATRDNAQIRYNSIKKAFDQHVATQTELDDAQTALRTAQASLLGAQKAVDEAQATLQYTIIRAPMTGVVIDKLVDAGTMAIPGQVLLTIYDRMQLVANVPESLIGRLKVGQDINVHIDRLNRTCIGQVSEIVPQGDPISRTFPVKVTGPCDGSIRKGMFARLLIPLDPEKVLVIPRSAVVRVGQLDMVDLADNGVFKRCVVQLGPGIKLDGGEIVQVLSGLRQGQKIATNPGGSGSNG